MLTAKNSPHLLSSNWHQGPHSPVGEDKDMQQSRSLACQLIDSICLTHFDVSLCSLHVQASVAALSLLKARLPGRFPTELTGLWTGLAEDRKWRRDIAEALLRAKLLNGPEMDAHLSKVLQLSRSSTQTVEFAVHLVSPPFWLLGTVCRHNVFTSRSD